MELVPREKGEGGQKQQAEGLHCPSHLHGAEQVHAELTEKAGH